MVNNRVTLLLFNDLGRNMLLRGVNMCLNLAMFFFIAKFLTLEEFGFFGVMMTYFFIISFIANQSLDNYSSTLKVNSDLPYFIKSVITKRIAKSWIGFFIVSSYLLWIKDIEAKYFLMILMAGLSMLINFDWYFILQNLYRKVIYRQLSVTVAFILAVLLIRPDLDGMILSYGLILILSTCFFHWKQIMILFKKTRNIPFTATDFLPDIRFLIYFCIHIFHNIIFILSYKIDNTLVGEYTAAYRIFTVFISLGTIYLATNQKSIVDFFRNPLPRQLNVPEFSLVIAIPILLWLISFHFLTELLYDFQFFNLKHYFISFGLFVSFFTINQFLLLGFFAKGIYKFPLLIYLFISAVSYSIITFDYFNSVLVYIYIVSIGELLFLMGSSIFYLKLSFNRGPKILELLKLERTKSNLN